MELDLKNLQYYLIHCNQIGFSTHEIYQNTYSMWKRVWSEAMVDLKVDQTLYSDGFTRQSKLGCLFYKNECVAMSAFREVNLDTIVQREDSLLRSWTESSFRQLMEQGSKVSICSYLTVSPEFRGEIAPDMTLKLLTAYLATEYLLHSDCDVMTGTMRCNRGTDKVAYKAGARFLEKSEMFGVEVDLVGFFKREIEKDKEQYSHDWSRVLWESRIELFSETPKLRIAKQAA